MTDTGAGGNRQLFMMMALIGLVLLALGVGFFGGFMMRERQPVAAGAAPAAGQPAQAGTLAPAQGQPADQHGAHGGVCAYELPEKDKPILAGLICNCKEGACNNTPLLDCHCGTAHAIKSLTKQMIVEGMAPKEIVAELEKRWGSLHTGT